MARPLKKPTTDIEVFMSNFLTTAYYDYSAQEKRILYRIIERAFEHRKANWDYYEAHDGELVVKEHVAISLPITMFMSKEQQAQRGGGTDKLVTDAFDSMVKKTISITFDENKFGYRKGDYVGGSLVNLPELKEGTMSFIVHKFVWQAALDFSKGFTKLDFVTAMDFKSAYSMRFYEIAQQYQKTRFWITSVEEFRKKFGCENKYPLHYELKRCIIDVAKKELDAIAPLSFTLEEKKEGRKVVQFIFRFYDNKKNFDSKEQHGKNLSSNPQGAISNEIKDWLKKKMLFTAAQIHSNIVLFDNFCSIFKNDTITELEETFQYISSQGCRPQENVGWFIQNLKKKVENATEGISTKGKKELENKLSNIYDKFNSSKK